MSLHPQTLKAAVKKYGPLHTEGKSEGEIRTEIELDEKAFDQDGVNEIYAAIVAGANSGDNGGENSNGSGEGDKGGEGDKETGAKAATGTKSGSKSSKASYIVAKEFRDLDNFEKTHKVGTDVSHFDAVRLAKLVELELVEKK